MKKIDDPVLIKEIIRLYTQEKFSMNKISKEFKISDSTVKRILVENNIEIKKRNHPYEVKKGLFSKIQTEEDAYWLGFMYADGNVKEKGNLISLDLAEKDRDMVEKFRIYCGINKELYKHVINRNDKQYISYSCNFSDAETKQNLIKLGCVPHKSLILKCPSEEQVPQELYHHFIRGYFDGDGFSRWSNEGRNFVLLGTEEFLIGTIKRMGWEGHCKVRQDGEHKDFRLESYTASNVYSLMKSIYKDATIYMPRKYNTYLIAKQELSK